tara:strand:- start:2029 stop:2250 length:222 start_codon:yes stop_codon:yes gene_type:complete
MGEKSKHRRFQLQYFGIVYETFQYFTVTNMHTIKSANGNGSRVRFIVIGDALNCYHKNGIIKKLIFEFVLNPA